MALEVGRISATIEAKVSDFEQKMAGAQKTFEGTQVKMEAVANRATTSLRKAYSDRVVAAHQAAQQEIAAAQQTMKERLRFATSTAEISAIRKLYRERVDAARTGAQQEIQAAQQSFLASTKNMAPVAGSLNDVVKAAGRAAPGINSVRSALTAMAASALQTAPGVAQVSSVLGAMALGAGPMVAILAGIAGVTFAWQKLTAAGKELTKAAEDALAAVAKLDETEASRLAGTQATLDAKRAAIDDEIAELRELDPLNKGYAKAQEKINELLKERDKLVRATTRVETAITEFHKKELDQRAKDQQEALDKEQRAFEKHAEEIVRKWQRMQLKLTPFEIRERVRLGNAGQVGLVGRTPLDPKVAQAFIAAGGAAARGAGAGAGGPGNTVPGKSLTDMLKSRLDPKQLLTNLASNVLSGGISAAVGILGKFADGLFDFGGKAKAAAAALAEARRQWSVELDRFLADETGKQKIDAAETLRAWIKGFSENFKLTAGRGAILKEFPTIPANLNLEGLIAWVDKFLDANRAFLSPEAIARWEELQKAAHKLGEELADTTKAANDTVASLINVPTGFKIALARFNATIPIPTMPATIPQGPRGGFNPTASSPNGTMAARNVTYVFQDGIHVEANDPAEFLQKLEVEIQRKKLRGGATITLDYSS